MADSKIADSKIEDSKSMDSTMLTSKGAVQVVDSTMVTSKGAVQVVDSHIAPSKVTVADLMVETSTTSGSTTSGSTTTTSGSTTLGSTTSTILISSLASSKMYDNERKVNLQQIVSKMCRNEYFFSIGDVKCKFGSNCKRGFSCNFNHMKTPKCNIADCSGNCKNSHFLFPVISNDLIITVVYSEVVLALHNYMECLETETNKNILTYIIEKVDLDNFLSFYSKDSYLQIGLRQIEVVHINSQKMLAKSITVIDVNETSSQNGTIPTYSGIVANTTNSTVVPSAIDAIIPVCETVVIAPIASINAIVASVSSMATNAPKTTPKNAPKTTQTNAPKTTQTNAPKTTQTNAPKTTQTNASKTTQINKKKAVPVEETKTTQIDEAKNKSTDDMKTKSTDDAKTTQTVKETHMSNNNGTASSNTLKSSIGSWASEEDEPTGDIIDNQNDDQMLIASMLMQFTMLSDAGKKQIQNRMTNPELITINNQAVNSIVNL